jgi:hypothetical protein
MRRLVLAPLVVCAALVGACGKGASTGVVAGTTGASSSSGAVGTGGATSTSASSSTAGGTTSTSTSSSTGGAGPGSFAASIADVQMWVDCMPIVDPDPVYGSFTAKYDDSTGAAPASATVKSALLRVNGSATDTWTFTVTPQGSGQVPAGKSTSVVHTKDHGSGSGPKPPCGFCGNGNTWTLEVSWDVVGATAKGMFGPQPVTCAF